MCCKFEAQCLDLTNAHSHVSDRMYIMGMALKKYLIKANLLVIYTPWILLKEFGSFVSFMRENKKMT